MRDSAISVRVERELKERLEAVAREERRSLAQLVELVLVQFLESRSPAAKPKLRKK